MHGDTPALLDAFVPVSDAGGRHEILVHAPASTVMDVAQSFPIESLWVVRTLIRLRARFLGEPAQMTGPIGLIEQMQSIGWQRLAESPGHYLIAGAACQPWHANPAFTPIAAQQFAAFAEPDRVKIAWTLETVEIAPGLTRFATETRAVATDEQAWTKFKRYWRRFGAGIILIRLVLLPAVRRRAEKLWKAHEFSAAMRG